MGAARLPSLATQTKGGCRAIFQTTEVFARAVNLLFDFFYRGEVILHKQTSGDHRMPPLRTSRTPILDQFLRRLHTFAWGCPAPHAPALRGCLIFTEDELTFNATSR